MGLISLLECILYNPNMKYLLFSGPTKYNGDGVLIPKYLKELKCKKLLVIGFHRDDPRKAYQVVLDFDPMMKEFDSELLAKKEYKTGYLKRFDAIYILGGMNEPILELAEETTFGKEFTEWIESSNSKLYIGSSAGTMILGKYLYSSYVEGSEKYRGDTILGNGLNIFPEIMFDVHFTGRERETRLKKAMGEVEGVVMGIGIDEYSVILMDEDNKLSPEVIKGSMHIYRK